MHVCTSKASKLSTCLPPVLQILLHFAYVRRGECFFRVRKERVSKSVCVCRRGSRCECCTTSCLGKPPQRLPAIGGLVSGRSADAELKHRRFSQLSEV